MASVEISRITCLVTSLCVFLLLIANNGVRVTGQHVPLFACNFDFGFCGMNHFSDEWTQYNATPAKNTRPTSDHTTVPGKYVYTEVNSTVTGRLRTPGLPLNMSQTLSSLRVAVYVSMYGDRYQVGNLSVFAVDGNDKRTLLADWTDETPAWTLREIIKTEIPFWTNNSYVEFHGSLGNGGTNGMALDDLNITGSVKQIPSSSTTTTTGIVTSTTTVYVTSNTSHSSVTINPSISMSTQSSIHSGSTTVLTSTSTSISTIQNNATTTSQSTIPSTTGRSSTTNNTTVVNTIPSHISSGSVNATPGSRVTTATSSQLVSIHTTNLTTASGSPIPPRMPIAASGSPIPLWLAIPALILSCIALIITIAMVIWIVKKRSQVSDKAGPEPAQTDYYVGPVTQTPALLSTWISYRPNLKLRPPQPKLEYFDNDEVVVNEKIQLENSYTT